MILKNMSNFLKSGGEKKRKEKCKRQVCDWVKIVEGIEKKKGKRKCL